MTTTLAQHMGMAQKLGTLWPEITITLTAFAVMILGLSREEAARRTTYWLAMMGMGVACIFLVLGMGSASPLEYYVKLSTVLIGLGLLLVAADLPDESGAEPRQLPRDKFDPGLLMRGEFIGFMLLSLVGLMLCAGADDLVWLFLALELTSLPTYIMVSISRNDARAPEAGVKYFFLGAFAAGLFLYGFSLIYAGTGTTYLGEIHDAVAQGGMNSLTLIGVILAILGIAFKIAAFPMHLYAADVYEGAATPVTAFLAYVPKAAGFVTLILLLRATGWVGEGHDAIEFLLWTMAALTMFIGNTMALLQNNVKRVLAYSSIAHSGYMLVGLLAGPGGGTADGVSAVLFYLVVYGVMSVGAFAVLGLVCRGKEDGETFDDLRGLFHRRPGLAIILAICVLGLTGIPPLVGFTGKLYLIAAAWDAGYAVLVAMLVLNSAIAAWYYLRIFGVCFLQPISETGKPTGSESRTLAAMVCAAAILVMSLLATPLIHASLKAAGSDPVEARVQPVESVPSH